MEIGSDVVECSWSRTYFTELVERAETDEEIADFITLCETLSVNELELALPALCLLAEKCPLSLKRNMMDLFFCTLEDENSSKLSRKAAITCLKSLTHEEDSLWNDFFVLSLCLEESQFHIINPVLPRFDVLLQAVYLKRLDFKWIKLLILRALAHSNGWVRLWALEKMITVKPELMSCQQDFLFEVLMKLFNSNDLFWRILERRRLKSFIEALTKLFAEISQFLSDFDRGTFIRNVLRNLVGISNPSCLFFITKALAETEISRCLCIDDFPLIAVLAQKTRHNQYSLMRTATALNMIVFFTKVLELFQKCEPVMEIGVLTSFFSHEDPALLNSFLTMASTSQLLLQMPVPTDALQLVLRCHRDFSRDAFPALLWACASIRGEEVQLQKTVELELADRLVSVEEGVDMGLSSTIAEDVDILLAILQCSRKELEKTDQRLIQLIHGYILLRCAVAAEPDCHSHTIQHVYMNLLRRMKYSFKPLVELTLSLLSENGISLLREAVLVELLSEAFNDLKPNEKDEVIPKVVQYLKDDPLAPVRREDDLCNGKDINKVVSALHGYRLKLVLESFPYLFPNNYEEVLKECIDRLQCASAYSVAESYLEICDMMVTKVTCPRLLIVMVKAAVTAVNEERKSQFFLPALCRVLSLCSKKSVLAHCDVEGLVLEVCSDFMELAQLNPPVAFHISQCLVNVCSHAVLSERWVEMVFSLAVFGPIPKKENRVIDAAYEMIFECSGVDFNEVQKPILVLQRTRLNGICAALYLSKNNANFARDLVQHIVGETIVLNQNTSRSFGLSLPHRRSTRAASLLLLLIDLVEDQDVIDRVFSICASWIVDPCQQFSTKLLYEWVLVRLASRSPPCKQKLIGQERVFSNKRIGSVASWINMMVLMSRLDDKHSSCAPYIEMILPWATAQNFAVRCTAIAALRLLYATIPCEELKTWNLLQRIVEFDGEPAGNSHRIIENLLSDFYFGHLHPINHFDMQTILLELPAKTGMPPEETISVELLKKFNTSDIRSINNDPDFLAAPSLVYSALSKSGSSAPEMNNEELDEGSMSSRAYSFVQRKLITKERTLRDDCSLVVVASLVDKPNNLGGLCRTCEIFGVDEFVIADKVFAADSGFKALSLSSEKKQKIEAVLPECLSSYLEEMRKKGYTVVAAEQTTDSIYLHMFTFPKKTVLLVGDEKEGVPVHLLRCVDQTVEIHQFGQTRSLNVHVSAALFIAKYAEQVLLGPTVSDKS